MSKTPSLASDLAVTLKIVQAEIKTLREKAVKVRAAIKVARANAKTEKTIARQAKKNVASVKKADRIAKLEAKLLSLKTGNVGSVAIKMNKKPSACTTVYQMAA
jgi:hypothetical protein